MLDEPTSRSQASAPARLSPALSCPHLTPAFPESTRDTALASTGQQESAVSEHTAAHLPVLHTVPAQCKALHGTCAPDSSIQTAAEPHSHRIGEGCNACQSVVQQHLDAFQCTPPKRTAGHSDAGGDCPTTSLTLAASTPSTAWKTPAVGQAVVIPGVDGDGLTSRLQDVTPTLTAHQTDRLASIAGQQEVTILSHHLSPVTAAHQAGCSMQTNTANADHELSKSVMPGAERKKWSSSHAQMKVASVEPAYEVHTELCVPDDNAATAVVPGTPKTKTTDVCKTSSLDSDGLDDILAAISTPESAKVHVVGSGYHAPITGPAGFKPADRACAVAPADQPESRASISYTDDLAVAVVETERLGAQHHVLLKQLMQWGQGGLAPSLKHERATLLHKVVEVCLAVWFLYLVASSCPVVVQHSTRTCRDMSASTMTFCVSGIAPDVLTLIAAQSWMARPALM